jgi:PIN domain nuclease of toxin-antitoxin system
VILLDTHALLWLDAGHQKAAALARLPGPLHASPVSLFEIQLLIEHSKLRLKRAVSTFEDDSRWDLDAPPSAEWFARALPLSWTRDPFDRLLVAHAMYRGWKLATADARILEHLDPRHVLEL